MILGGKHPTAQGFSDGSVLIAAFYGTDSGGVIKAVTRESGDQDFSSVFVFQDDSNPPINLAIDFDTFHVVEGLEGPARWVLTVRFLGDGFTSEWTSADQGRTWKRVANV